MKQPGLLKIGVVLVCGLLLNACLGEPKQVVPEGCLTGVLTADGDTCQTLKSNQNGKLYSFYSDMNGYQIGDEVCLCGQVSTMTSCKTGTSVDVLHLDRSCPMSSATTNQYVFPLD